MPVIQNIIFDLGGVFLDLDVNKTIQAFVSLGFTEKMLNHDQNNKKVFWQFEVGKITPEEFRKGICDLLEKEIPDDEIDNAWNAMILGFKEEEIQLLLDLKSKYRTFLLSNTNIMHEKIYSDMLDSLMGIKMTDLFEKVYYSHEVGMGKPDPEIFSVVINDNGLNPEETLYIDDTEQHIESAKNLGVKCFLFPQNGDLKEILPRTS
ncbi:MAG: HAD family phosphatase [Bacteroidales bacterium]|nr:HAD family phosphatase [Bacteroidales bacterium]